MIQPRYQMVKQLKFSFLRFKTLKIGSFCTLNEKELRRKLQSLSSLVFKLHSSENYVLSIYASDDALIMDKSSWSTSTGKIYLRNCLREK